ncbi:UNVERIFIED_CONTAM: hypothetical protein PYX00_008690 [Menopon gallinae]|uniref:COMM domain-containing protein n=1 Tax=Menopon gallinae TaxID=328185 RepID=A0AAW2HP89_9NEOP
MIERTAELEKAVQVMNVIEEGKFPLLLNRIAQFLSSDTSSKPFTDAEESKLESSLEISAKEVQLVINGILEIFNKCAYHKIKPSLLGEDLEKTLKLQQKKAEAFTQVWTVFAKAIVENLKQKSFLPQLSHMAYSLSIATASDIETKEKMLRAQLQLGLTNDKMRDDINIEFTHDELYSFYQRLEQIQDQLDGLK